MDGVLLTKEDIIKNEKGDIFHFIKSTDEGFEKFGECYFSTINQNEIKGCTEKLSELFKNNDIEGVCRLKTRLKYFKKLTEEIRMQRMKII